MDNAWKMVPRLASRLNSHVYTRAPVDTRTHICTHTHTKKCMVCPVRSEQCSWLITRFVLCPGSHSVLPSCGWHPSHRQHNLHYCPALPSPHSFPGEHWPRFAAREHAEDVSCFGQAFFFLKCGCSVIAPKQMNSTQLDTLWWHNYILRKVMGRAWNASNH